MTCLFTSGMHASIKHGNGGGLVRQMAQAVCERERAFLNHTLSQFHPTLSPPAHLNHIITTHTPKRPTSYRATSPAHLVGGAGRPSQNPPMMMGPMENTRPTTKRPSRTGPGVDLVARELTVGSHFSMSVTKPVTNAT